MTNKSRRRTPRTRDCTVAGQVRVTDRAGNVLRVENPLPRRGVEPLLRSRDAKVRDIFSYQLDGTPTNRRPPAPHDTS